VRAFDLALDPAEEDPTQHDGRGDELVEVGQLLLRDNLRRRLWRSADEVELSAEHVEALRAIGYAGEDDG
jgi:hypothetical protein